MTLAKRLIYGTVSFSIPEKSYGSPSLQIVNPSVPEEHYFKPAETCEVNGKTDVRDFIAFIKDMEKAMNEWEEKSKETK